MIGRHISESLPRNGSVEDGLDIHSVIIEVGSSISVRFHQWFLNPCGVSPVCYSLAAVGDNIHRVQFAFGHPDENGRLKYDYTDKHHGRFESFPDSPAKWAHFLSRDYAVIPANEQAESHSINHVPLGRYLRRRTRRGR